MRVWSVLFAAGAAISAVYGFAGLDTGLGEVARVLALFFLLLWTVTLISVGRWRRRAARARRLLRGLRSPEARSRKRTSPG